MNRKQGRARGARLGAFVAAVSLQSIAFAAQSAPTPPPSCATQPEAKFTLDSSTFPDRLSQAGGGWAPNTVTLNGEPSRPNGQGVTYLWSFPNGQLGNLANITSSKAQYTPPDVVGTRQVTVRLTVSAPNCASSSKDLVLTILDANSVAPDTAPHATALFLPASPAEGELVTLDASSSYDAETASDKLTYTWSQVGGPAVVVTPDPVDPTKARFVAPNVSADTELAFALRVFDGSNEAFDTAHVYVRWLNEAPVARLQCPTGVIDTTEGANVVLDGSGSTDTDDGIVAYSWQQREGLPEIADVASWTTDTATFQAPNLGEGQDGMVPIRLTVRDRSGAESSADCAVFIHDVTAPVITVPSGDPVTAEATSPTGANVVYTASAHDNVDGDLPAPNFLCAPPSGSGFALNQTTAVLCSAIDSAGNKAATSFNLRVRDTTAPVIDAVESIGIEATGPDGAAADFLVQSHDIVDGVRDAACTPASGSHFPINAPGPVTHVTCGATDDNGNVATDVMFEVAVHDTTPPAFTASTIPADMTVEATSTSGAAAMFDAPAAIDLVDGAAVHVACAPFSGSTFPFGESTVTCDATDSRDNSTAGRTPSASAMFTVTVRDTIAPTLSNVPADMTVEATSASGSLVAYALPTAWDSVDGSRPVACTPAPGPFALGSTAVECSAADTHGNVGKAGFNVAVVDTTAPVLTVPSTIEVRPTSTSGAAVSFAVSALDRVDGNIVPQCSATSGQAFNVGSTTVTCTATDRAGNTGTASFTVNVFYGFSGFFQPVDALPAINSVKAGSAVPVKFSLSGNQGLDIFARNSPSSVAGSCAGASESAIEETVTAGNSSLQYDATTGQYIYVWKTDKSWVGQCRTLQVRLKDGTAAKVAVFKFK
jgi:hypothetical protein